MTMTTSSQTNVHSDLRRSLYLSSDIKQGIVVIANDLIIIHVRRHVYTRSSLLRVFYYTHCSLSPPSVRDDSVHLQKKKSIPNIYLAKMSIYMYFKYIYIIIIYFLFIIYIIICIFIN